MQLIPQNVNVPANFLGLGDNLIGIWLFLKGSKKVKSRFDFLGRPFDPTLLDRPLATLIMTRMLYRVRDPKRKLHLAIVSFEICI